MPDPFKKFTFLVSFIISLFLLTACESKSKNAANTPKANPPVIVDVLIATKESIENVIEANGTVIANEFVELRPEVSGRLVYLNLPEGKLINKGTVVARVNDADLRAQISKTKVQLELAQITLNRLKQLLDINGLNQAEYDNALNQVNSLQADIVYTQTLVDKTVIRAPFTGVAGLRQISPGAYVTPASVIATLQQVSQLKIDFTLPELYANNVRPGSVVEVELDATAKIKGTAVVLATEPGANTNTRNLKVRALLKGNANPGAFVKVYVDAGIGRSSVIVPANCIIPDDKFNLVILVKKGKASFVNVQTGLRESGTVEITKGIEVGDSIVVTGVLFARPNGNLKVRGVKKMQDLTGSIKVK